MLMRYDLESLLPFSMAESGSGSAAAKSDGSLFTPIDTRRPAWKIVVERLMELIESGQLLPGQRLPGENDLAKAMHVSRPVVREALSGLSTMGVIESRKGGGSFVSDLSAERLMAPLMFLLSMQSYDLVSLFRARDVIETSLAQDAATNATPEQIERLNELVRAGYEAAPAERPFKMVDSDFHEQIGVASGNEFLTLASRALYALGFHSRRLDVGQHPNVLELSAIDHDNIVKAITARDPDGAAAAMQVHLRRIRDVTLPPAAIS